MPVTARLSRKFYEKFGDEVANELVEWFNLVDATYRSDLRELNELNFARFDAKLEQRFAAFEVKFEQRLAVLHVDLEGRIAQTRADLIKWMFIFWVGNVATTIAIIATALKLVH